MTEQKNNKNKHLPFSFKPLFRHCGVDDAVRMDFVEEQSDINAQDKYGMTMAMYGAMYGDKSVLEYCKKHNADFNIQDDEGWTAIMAAAVNHNYWSMLWLLNNVENIDLTKRTRDGQTIFNMAAFEIHDILTRSKAKQVKDANVKIK